MKKQPAITLALLIFSLLSACGSQTDQTPLVPATAIEAVVHPTQPPMATETFIAVPTGTITTSLPAETPAATTNEVSFTNDVMPIFEASCIECHGGEKTKEGLDLKTYESLMAGSSNGPVLEAGNAEDSFFVQQIIEGEMPKRGDKLSPSAIQIIIKWVNAGALNN